MARAPVAGSVKTRLAREAGTAAATGFARHSAAALLARLAGDRRWNTCLAVTPDTATSARCWPAWTARMAQGRGDLGQRMQHLMQLAPPGPAIIIGTDIPAVTPAHIARAFHHLGASDAVFGPARDGGYWLVGLKRRPALLRPFGAVRWSSPHALEDTLANLRGRAVARLDTLSDVDDADSLHSSRALVGRRVLPRGTGGT